MIYTIFSVERKHKGAWINELIFYQGDLSHVDLIQDARFKELPTRKLAKFIGADKICFPIKYPLNINGIIINKGDYQIIKE